MEQVFMTVGLGFMCLSVMGMMFAGAFFLAVSRGSLPLPPTVAQVQPARSGGNSRRREVEIVTTRIPDHQETQHKRLLLEAGYTLDSTRAVNGNANGRLIDITAYRVL